jgi:hypothetical protein
VSASISTSVVDAEKEITSELELFGVRHATVLTKSGYLVVFSISRYRFPALLIYKLLCLYISDLENLTLNGLLQGNPRLEQGLRRSYG